MTTQEIVETNFLRIINREMMENKLDPVCYSEAQRRSSKGSNSTMKFYVALRLKALKAVGSGIPVMRGKSSLMTTQSCHKHRSRNTKNRYDKSSRERCQKQHRIELWVSNLILFIGSISAICCLWSFRGESVSNLPYLPLAWVVAVIQLIPWMIRQSGLCSYLSATTSLCILVACVSCGSGVKLLKSDPIKQEPVDGETKILENTITIIPAASGSSAVQQTAALSKN